MYSTDPFIVPRLHMVALEGILRVERGKGSRNEWHFDAQPTKLIFRAARNGIAVGFIAGEHMPGNHDKLSRGGHHRASL